MSDCTTGFAARLRDKSLAWTDRIKLIRYVWKFDVATIPNRRQFLLDLVLKALTTKSSASGLANTEEALLLWRCLADMLQSLSLSYQAQQGLGHESLSFVKMSMVQALLEHLELCTNAEHDDRFDCIITSICGTLVDTPQLSLSHIASFENMLRLLSSAARIAGNYFGESERDDITFSCLRLIEAGLPHYLSAQRQKSSSREIIQVMGEVNKKLLWPTIRLCVLVEHQSTTGSESVQQETRLCVDGLLDALSASLFHRDLMQHYEQFLQPKKKRKLKIVEQDSMGEFFCGIRERLETDDTRADALHVLPWLCRRFTACYWSESPKHPLLLLQYLSSEVLGIWLTAASSETAVQADFVTNGLTSAERLGALSDLLGCVYDLDLYDPRSDTEDKMLGWFSHLIDFILSATHRCPAWYRCVRWLLLLTPSSTDKKFIVILTNVWTMDSDEAGEEVKSSQDELLAEIVRIYSKLSRVEKLISRMFESARTMSGMALFSKEFVACLRTGFSSLPQKTVISIWTMLNQTLTKRTDYSPEGLVSVCHLARLFLSNIRVIDQISIESTRAKFESLFSDTVQFAVNGLREDCVDKKSTVNAVAWLTLLHACGDLRLVVPSGSPSHISVCITASDSTHCSDLSSLFPGLQPAKWVVLHQMVVQKSDWQLLLLWEKLLCQSLRASALSSQPGSDRLLKQVCDFVILESLGRTSASSLATWDGQLSSVTEETFPIAHWSLIGQHLFYVYELATNDSFLDAYEAVISEYLIETIVASDKSTCLARGVTLRDVTVGLLDDPATHSFHGLARLHSALLTAALRGAAKLLRPSSTGSTSKKRKSSSLDTALSWASIADVIDALSGGGNNSTPGAAWLPSEELLMRVDQLLEAGWELGSIGKIDAGALDSTIKVLLYLPLRSLSTPDQIRCLLSALLLLAPLQRRSGEAEIRNACGVQMTLLRVLLLVAQDGRGVGHVLSVVQSGWIVLSLCALRDSIQLLDMADKKSLKLCDDIIRLFLSHSMSHVVSLQHLIPFTRKIAILLQSVPSDDIQSERRAGENKALPACQATSALTNLVITMETVAKALRRHHQRPELQSALTALKGLLISQFDSSLSHWARSVTSESMTHQVDDDSDSRAAGSSRVFAQLLTGFICLLELSSKAKAQDLDSDGEKEERVESMEVLTFLPDLCRSCLASLSSSKDTSVIRSCLRFVCVLSSTPANIHDERLPKDFFNDVWTLSIARFRRLTPESGLSDEPMEMDTSGEEAVPSREVGVDRECRADWIQTLATVVLSFPSHQFDTCLQQLLLDMRPMSAREDAGRITAALEIWQQVAELGLPSDVIDRFYYLSQKVLLLVQQLLSDAINDTEVVVVSLQTLTKLLAYSSNFLNAQDVSVCLHSLTSDSLDSNRSLEDFVRVHGASYDLLNSMLIGHAETVSKMVPAFSAAFRHLMLSAMRHGRQQTVVTLSEHQLDRLKTCAQNVERLAVLMCEHKVDFAKGAPYLVADYSSEAQKLTLYPIVKRALLFAVYRLLDICSDHGVAQLNTVLPGGARELFKVIHSDFVNYYRYKGKA